MKPIPTWEPLAGPAKALVWLVGLTGGFSAIQALQLLLERGHLHQGTSVSPSGIGWRVGPEPIQSIVSLVSLAAGILWLIWQHRGHTNLRARGVTGLRFTPGWAVGWWFVPLASLVMPYFTMRELWDHAGVASGTAVPRRRPIVTWWWVYLASSTVGLLAAGAFLSSFVRWIKALAAAPSGQVPQLTFTADALRQIYLWLALGGFVRALAAALAIKVVLDITRREDAAAPAPSQPGPGFLPPRPDLFATPG